MSKVASLYNVKEGARFHTIHAEIQNKFRLIESELNGMPYFSGEKFHLIDAVYGPIFRYFDVFDTFTNLNTFDDLPKCLLWKSALKQRRSVRNAVSKDYLRLLIEFLINRESYISQLILMEDR